MKSRIEELARECGDSLTDKRGRVDFMFDDHGLYRFANSILELAARECDNAAKDCQSDEVESAIKSRAEAIRKLKL